MIPPIDQARRYLSKIDPSISGQHGHDKTYHVACVIVNGFGLGMDEARSVIQEYSARCIPPWSDPQLEHKLNQALQAPEPKGRGHLLRNGVSYRYGDSEQRPMPAPIRRDEPPKSLAGRYEVDAFVELPEPISDPTRELIKSAFAPGEGIRIAQGKNNEEGREIPKDGGICLSREEWLRKLDANDGQINKFMRTSERNGIFVSVNPMRIGGSKDSDVTSFRHCLIEWDGISVEEQWSLIKQSNLPCSAVLLSGNKSIHAWVNIDAKDRVEFNERVKIVYDHFSEYKPDTANKNPSRYSRLPGCERGKKRQELLALRCGAASFGEWYAGLASESAGQVTSISDLLAFDAASDPNAILGNRWLCKGGSCVFVGQSGLGKSSLAIQAAVTWALGRSLFGIQPVRPLKSLFIQAENDKGDLAEMVQGVVAGLGCTPEELELINRNVIIVRDTVHTAFEFVKMVQRLIDVHKPDLSWFDPLLHFIGDDISRQSVCSTFLRTWLGPIAEATGVCWMMMHHTGKPATDPKSKSKWLSTDFSYSGIGSSELTNWARAIVNLERFDESSFKLMLSKRGKRAGAKDPLGNPTCHVWLQHSATAIFWEQISEPEDAKKESKKSKYSGKKDESKRSPHNPKLEEMRDYINEFRDRFTDTEVLSMAEVTRRLQSFALDHGVQLKDKVAEGIIEELGRENDAGKSRVISVKTTTEGFEIGLA